MNSDDNSVEFVCTAVASVRTVLPTGPRVSITIVAVWYITEQRLSHSCVKGPDSITNDKPTSVRELADTLRHYRLATPSHQYSIHSITNNNVHEGWLYVLM